MANWRNSVTVQWNEALVLDSKSIRRSIVEWRCLLSSFFPTWLAAVCACISLVRVCAAGLSFVASAAFNASFCFSFHRRSVITTKCSLPRPPFYLNLVTVNGFTYVYHGVHWILPCLIGPDCVSLDFIWCCLVMNECNDARYFSLLILLTHWEKEMKKI